MYTENVQVTTINKAQNYKSKKTQFIVFELAPLIEKIIEEIGSSVPIIMVLTDEEIYVKVVTTETTNVEEIIISKLLLRYQERAKDYEIMYGVPAGINTILDIVKVD
jgi:hypothetical protein